MNPTTDKRGGIPLSEWSGSAATDRLRGTIEAFNAESERYGRRIERLTWAMLLLAIAQLAAAVVQIVWS